MQTKRQRLINMRECLRQVQKMLPKGELNQNRSSFICNNIPLTTCSHETEVDVKKLIMRAIAPYWTFDDWMEANNRHRRFTYEQMMDYRQRWINQLCDDISREIAKTEDLSPLFCIKNNPPI